MSAGRARPRRRRRRAWPVTAAGAMALVALLAHAIGCGRSDLYPAVARVEAGNADADADADADARTMDGGGPEVAPPRCPAGCAPGQVCGRELFLGARAFRAGNGPWGLAVGDLDGDGRLDVAVAAYDDDAVKVLLGNGDGTLGAPASFAVGQGPVSVAIGDLDGDGRPDLAVANRTSYDVSVLPGRGDGSFAAARALPIGAAATSVALGDLNGDGRSDIVTSSFSGTFVLMGKGGGAFAPARGVAMGGRATSVAVADLDGDGRLDLAITNEESNSVSVLPGKGDGTFGPGDVLEVGMAPSSVTAGDFDGDGRLDLAVANATSNDVSVLLGQGGGSFQARAWAVGQRPLSIVAGDLDSDGALDLAVASDFADEVSVLPGQGDGTFGPRLGFLVEGQPFSVAIGDASGDGAPDLVVANWNSRDVAVILGHADAAPLGLAAAYDFRAAGGGVSAVALADLNGDGRIDLAAATRETGRVVVLAGDGHGAFAPMGNARIYDAPSALATGDIDGDGVADLAIANGTAHSVTVVRGGLGGDMFDMEVGGTPTALAVGDIDGDGCLDLAVALFPPSPGIALFPGRCDGQFEAAGAVLAGVAVLSLAFGDVDGDGRADLVVSLSPGMDLALLLGNGDGTFRQERDFGLADVLVELRPSGNVVALADVDGDGALDLLVDGPSRRDLSVFAGDGRGRFGLRRRFIASQTPGAANAFAAGDVDGDGAIDIVMIGNDGFDVLRGTRGYRCW